MQQGRHEIYLNAFIIMLILRMCILLYILQKHYTNVNSISGSYIHFNAYSSDVFEELCLPLVVKTVITALVSYKHCRSLFTRLKIGLRTSYQNCMAFQTNYFNK